jgi:hypothetical protein
VLFADYHVSTMRRDDFNFGYDGSPHRHFRNVGDPPYTEPRPGTYTDQHAEALGMALGLGARNDRTWESMLFWYNGNRKWRTEAP